LRRITKAAHPGRKVVPAAGGKAVRVATAGAEDGAIMAAVDAAVDAGATRVRRVSRLRCEGRMPALQNRIGSRAKKRGFFCCLSTTEVEADIAAI
jgi:hypothetical protein